MCAVAKGHQLLGSTAKGRQWLACWANWGLIKTLALALEAELPAGKWYAAPATKLNLWRGST